MPPPPTCCGQSMSVATRRADLDLGLIAWRCEVCELRVQVLPDEELDDEPPRPPPSQPTDAAPGSPDKVEVMRQRHARGEQIHHPQDELRTSFNPLPATGRRSSSTDQKNTRHATRALPRGVTYLRQHGKYRAVLYLGSEKGKEVRKYLGQFDTAEEAVEAVRKARGKM